MRRVLAVAGLCVLATAGGAAAQEVTAEVQTWTGRLLVLSDPTFEVYYTFVPPERATGCAPAGYGATVGTPPPPPAPDPAGAPLPSGVAVTGIDPATALTTAMPAVIGTQDFGAMQATIGPLLPTGPLAVHGRCQQQILRLSREGLETRVPVTELAAVLFLRRQVLDSPLPPYVAGTHYRYSASAVLSDGSQVQADYVNLGTTVLRGTTPQGIVDIPWFEVESIKFRR